MANHRYYISPAQVALSKRIEAEREAACITLPCPNCQARPGATCHNANGDGYNSSHLGRYRAAARLGLVPWLVGDRG